jgi:hypothetical protein
LAYYSEKAVTALRDPFQRSNAAASKLTLNLKLKPKEKFFVSTAGVRESTATAV